MKKLFLSVLLVLLSASVGAQQTTSVAVYPTIAAMKALNPTRPSLIEIKDSNPGLFMWGTTACVSADDIFEVTPTAGPSGCYTRMATPYQVGKASPVSSILAANGSGLPAFTTTLPAINTSAGLVTATGATTAISQAVRAARQFYVADFGAVCDGSTNDRVAIQAAIAASYFGTLNFPKTQCAVDNATTDYALLASSPISLKCEQGGGIKPLATVPDTASTLYFTGSTATYARTIIDGCFIGNNSSGTRFGLHGIVFDTQTAGWEFNQPVVMNSRVQQSVVATGYAVLAINNQTNNPVGGFKFSQFIGNIFYGGVHLSKSGDTHTFINNVIQGSNESIRIDLVNGGSGKAGNVVISGLNSGSAAGAVVVVCSNSTLITNSELEQSVTNTNPNNAIVDAVGVPVTCQNGPVIITGNQIQTDSGVGDPTLIFIGGTTGAVIDNNRLATPSAYTHVIIGAAAIGTTVGAGNTYIGGGTDVTDGGASTRSTLAVPGLASFAVGDLLYADTTTTLARLADVATTNVLTSGGIGVAPSWGKVALGALATQATNTVLGNATSGAAVPTALAVGTCSTSSSALNWTTNTGFGCNTSINAATLNGATFAAPGAIGGGTPAAGTFTTGTFGGALTGITTIATSNALTISAATGNGSKVALVNATASNTFNVVNADAGNNGFTGFGIFNVGTGVYSLKLVSDNLQLAGNITSVLTTDAALTTRTVCQNTANNTFHFGSGALGVCLGTSSARFKHDVVAERGGLDRLVGLRPVGYKYNGGDERVLYGFIAEDVASAMPEVVSRDATGAPNSVDMLGMIPFMVNALKELKAANDNLRAELIELRGRVK